jgi:hypothetical protein
MYWFETKLPIPIIFSAGHWTPDIQYTLLYLSFYSWSYHLHSSICPVDSVLDFHLGCLMIIIWNILLQWTRTEFSLVSLKSWHT